MTRRTRKAILDQHERRALRDRTALAELAAGEAAAASPLGPPLRDQALEHHGKAADSPAVSSGFKSGLAPIT